MQFVGFMGAYRADVGLDPMIAGVLGAILTTWVTFVPCFLWIFLDAPYIEYLRGNHRLTSALSAITAAVVGVVLNLAVWFSLHPIFGRVGETRAYGLRLYLPELATADLLAAAIAVAAFLALFTLRWPMLPTFGQRGRRGHPPRPAHRLEGCARSPRPASVSRRYAATGSACPT